MNNELFRVVDSVAFDNPSVALSARQGYLLNQRISQLSLFSISDGLVPIGAVIAILGVFSGPNNTGVFTSSPSADNNLAGSGNVSKNGFQLCDGKKVSDEAVSFFKNAYMPLLTDDRFLKGSVSSGSTSGVNGRNQGNNTVILTTAELPSHTHTITSTAASTPITITSTGTSGAAGGHDHYGYTYAGGDHSHNFWRTDRHYLEIEGAYQGRQWCGGNDRIENNVFGAGSHQHSVYVNPVGNHTHSLEVTGTNTGHTHIITSNAANTGNGEAFNIEPKYITVQYYMRVR